jgi:N6-adenosine-specific RNA methylase IME4
MIRFGTVALKPARVLHVDCPWKHKDKLPGKTRGARRRYPCMTVAQLKAIELPPLHDNCLMFFWRMACMQQEALDVIRAWDFTVKSELVWEKLSRRRQRPERCPECGHRDHKHAFGMGRYVRLGHEVCLIATRGRVQVKTKAQRSSFEAMLGPHSEKPDEIFKIARRLSRGPYTELFGRAPRQGWQVLGNDPALLWDAGKVGKPSERGLVVAPDPRQLQLRLVG